MITKQGYFVFEELQEFPGVIHGISTRKFGNMSAKFSNLEKTLSNRESFLSLLGINIKDLVLMEQVHGSKIVIVDRKHIGRAQTNDTLLNKTDAMICKIPGVYLAVFTADCLPVIFYEPHKKIFGLAHIGWKGIIEKLAFKMIRKFKSLDADIDNIKVFIGPSIGSCHYDIDPKKDDRIELFQHEFANKQVVLKKKDKYFLDLWKAVEIQLIELGVRKQDIINERICTVCEKEYFSSYHLDRDKKYITSMSVIGLKE